MLAERHGGVRLPMVADPGVQDLGADHLGRPHFLRI